MITKTCAISGETFVVRDEDLAFLEKISPIINTQKYLIPAPTLCPREREKRRLTYRNERKLHRRKSSLSNTPIISFFSQNSPFIVYTADEWWSDKWDPMNYGRIFDFNRPFFEQFYDLQLVVPRAPLVNNKADNSDYCNFADANKNCYLITSSNDNRDCYYGFLLVKNRDSLDCSFCTNCELAYGCIDCRDSYNINFCQNCDGCIDSDFLLNCRGVNNCFACVNLQNKEQFQILNEQYSKEEYLIKIKEIKNDPVKMNEILSRFKELILKFPVRAINAISCENVLGDYIFNSKNIFNGFVVYDSENCAYLHEGLRAKNCQDICFFDTAEWCYESTSLIGYGYRFTNFCRNSVDLFYCDSCHGCENCFGCIGLRRKKYCILNKQYSKDDYETLLSRIIQHMISKNEWGEFFPSKYSLFPYNETLAQEFFPPALSSTPRSLRLEESSVEGSTS